MQYSAHMPPNFMLSRLYNCWLSYSFFTFFTHHTHTHAQVHRLTYSCTGANRNRTEAMHGTQLGITYFQNILIPIPIHLSAMQP